MGRALQLPGISSACISTCAPGAMGSPFISSQGYKKVITHMGALPIKVLPGENLQQITDAIEGRIFMSEARARTEAQAKALAEEQGLTAFFPNDNELFLGYDRPFDIAIIRTQAEVLNSVASIVLQKSVKFTSQHWTKSVNGNAHLYIRLQDPYPYAYRMVMECILGSDLVRESYNLIRHMENTTTEAYNMSLFETEEMAKTVVQWRRQEKFKKYRDRIVAAKDLADTQGWVDGASF